MTDLSARLPSLGENNYCGRMVEPSIPTAAKSGEECESKVNARVEDKEEDDQYTSEVRDIVSRLPVATNVTAPERPLPLSISISRDGPKHPVSGPSDFPSAQGSHGVSDRVHLFSAQESQGFASALASARPIEDLKGVPYPEGVRPNPEFNFAFTPHRFRYHREFLLQFMSVCKEVPHSAMPLVGIEALGLRPGDPVSPTQARTGGRRVGSMGMGGTPMQRSGSVGLGLGSGLAKGRFAMGNFQTPSSRLGDSQSRFEVSSRGAGIPSPGPASSRLTPMTRSASQGGVGGGGPRETKRTRSQRGNNRNKMRSGFQTPQQQIGNLEPVAPLVRSENRWVAGSTLRTPQQIEERQLVERKVKALLNKLTMKKFDSISDQIIEFANKSEQERDGSTLMQVIKLVFEKAKDEEAFSEMYARLCRKMMERVSPNVQDETIRNAEGQPITGGMLFRKYLLNRCQEDFERGWRAKEAAVAAAASKVGDDQAAEAAGETNGEVLLYSDVHYAAAKAERQGLGLVRFIGELFKLKMLTERIMHECIKKLLSNVVNPEEEELKSLCKLLTTVGQSLDNPKARNHMDIYFERMQEMAKGSNISPRMQFMLLDVIKLRARHWQPHSAAPQAPPSSQGQGKHDDRHGAPPGERRDTTNPDSWNVASGASARPPARAGSLSEFGKISKPTGTQFGASSVFIKKDPKREGSLPRLGGADMFSMLSAVEGTPAPERPSNSRKPSMDLGPGGSPAAASGERRKLNLAPRTKPLEDKAENKEEDKEEATPTPAAMTAEEAQTKVKEDVKVYLSVENIDEAIMALEALPAEHRHLFVEKLVSAAFDGDNKAVVLAEKLFAAARDRQVVSDENFERGLLPTIEFADDISTDVPKTYEWLTRFIIAAGFDSAKTKELTGKIQVEGEPRVHPQDFLIRAFEKVWSAWATAWQY